MLPLPEVVSSLGFGPQAVIAASMLLVAWYVYRVIGIARLVTGALAALTRELLVLLVVAALVIGLGWASPNTGVVLEHIRGVWAFSTDRGVSSVRELLGFVRRMLQYGGN